MRNDTHDEQRQLYPNTLRVLRDRFLPTREEWTARAEHEVRTQCYPSQRVSQDAEHYLTAEEIEELAQLDKDLSKATRPVVMREIKRLKEVLREPDTGKDWRAYKDWYDQLTEAQQEDHSRLRILEEVRRDLHRRARGITTQRHSWYESGLDRSVHDVPNLVPDQDGLALLRELRDKLATLRIQAAQEAEQAAIDNEVRRRNTDTGWLAELDRRESYERYFDHGPVITRT